MTREEAIEILEEVKTIDDSMYQYNEKYLQALDMAIKALEQEPKTGHWIKINSGDKVFPESIVCSVCGGENSYLDFGIGTEPIGKYFVKSKFCPHCGCRMVEPQTESEEQT